MLSISSSALGVSQGDAQKAPPIDIADIIISPSDDQQNVVFVGKDNNTPLAGAQSIILNNGAQLVAAFIDGTLQEGTFIDASKVEWNITINLNPGHNPNAIDHRLHVTLTEICRALINTPRKFIGSMNLQFEKEGDGTLTLPSGTIFCGVYKSNKAVSGTYTSPLDGHMVYFSAMADGRGKVGTECTHTQTYPNGKTISITGKCDSNSNLNQLLFNKDSSISVTVSYKNSACSGPMVTIIMNGTYSGDIANPITAATTLQISVADSLVINATNCQLTNGQLTSSEICAGNECIDTQVLPPLLFTSGAILENVVFYRDLTAKFSLRALPKKTSTPILENEENSITATNMAYAFHYLMVAEHTVGDQSQLSLVARRYILRGTCFIQHHQLLNTAMTGMGTVGTYAQAAPDEFCFNQSPNQSIITANSATLAYGKKYLNGTTSVVQLLVTTQDIQPSSMIVHDYCGRVYSEDNTKFRWFKCAGDHPCTVVGVSSSIFSIDGEAVLFSCPTSNKGTDYQFLVGKIKPTSDFIITLPYSKLRVQVPFASTKFVLAGDNSYIASVTIGNFLRACITAKYGDTVDLIKHSPFATQLQSFTPFKTPEECSNFIASV